MQEEQQSKKSRFDDESTSYMIDAFGDAFYSSTVQNKKEILEHISVNLTLNGNIRTPDEINEKFKSLRRSYYKCRKESEENGLEVKWKFYEKLDRVLKEKYKPRKIKRTFEEASESPSVKSEPGIDLISNNFDETPRKRARLDTSTSSNNEEDKTPPNAHSMYKSYNENPYNFANSLIKEQFGESPYLGFPLFPTSPQENTVSRSHPSPLTPASSIPSNDITSDITLIINQLLVIQAKQLELNRKRQELESEKAKLDVDANNLISLLLYKVAGVVMSQLQS